MTRFFIIFFILFSVLNAEQKLEKVSLKLNWKYQFQFAGFIAAKEKGFYKDAGLDVKIIQRDKSVDFIQDLIDEKYDYTLSGSRIFFHKDLKKIKLLANYLKQSPLAIISKSKYLTVNSLRGKNIMSTKLGLTYDSVSLLFDKYQMSIDDINLLPLSYKIEDFLDDKTDAMTLYTTDQLYYLDKENINYNLFSPSNYGLNTPELNLISTADTYNNHKDRTIKFIEATNKGWAYALANKKELIDLIYNKYSKRKSINFLNYEADKIEEMFLTNLFAIGEINTKFYQTYFNYLHEKKNINFNFFDLFHQTNKLQLTAKEKEWKKKKKSLELVVVDNGEPFVFLNKQGEYEGFMVDYAKEVSKLLNLDLKFTKEYTRESVQKISFIKIPTMNVSKNKHLLDKNVITDSSYIKNNYAENKIELIQNYNNAFSQIESYKKSLFITNELSLKYWMKKDTSFSFNVEKKLHELVPYFLYYANETERESLTTIKKAINFIPDDTKRSLYLKWTLHDETLFDYDLLYKVSFFVLMIILIILYFNYKLKNKVIQRTQEIKNLLKTFDENILGLKINKKHETTYISDALLKKTDFTVEDLEAQKFYKIFDDNISEMVNAINSKTEWSGELKAVLKDKTTYWAKVTLTKELNVFKELIGFNIFIEDISIKKDFEDLNKSLELKVLERTKNLRKLKDEKEILLTRTMDSIKYASMIQYSIVPEENEYNFAFDEYFVIWEPRDIVGGDIYFVELFNNKNDMLLFVIDCTGHGVHGALLTMLVKAIQKQIMDKYINTQSVISPSVILSEFNHHLNDLLSKNNKETDMGFDGAVFYYNKNENSVKFAGAKTPLYFIQNGKLNTVKSNRISIGYNNNIDFEFKEYEIDIKDETYFYLSTDGFYDQNGGSHGFPFGKKAFEKLIQDNYEKDFKEQKDIFLDTLNEYSSKKPRNDDVCFLAFKIKPNKKD